jgi:hypothetical protein
MLVRQQDLQPPGIDEKEINDFAFRISPDGGYVALVVNSNLFFQEMLVIDTLSGKVVFEGKQRQLFASFPRHWHGENNCSRGRVFRHIGRWPIRS